MSEQRFRWDYRQQPPMAEIAETVANMTDGMVRLTMPDTGGDEYELVVSVSLAAPLRERMGVQIGDGNNQVNTFASTQSTTFGDGGLRLDAGL